MTVAARNATANTTDLLVNGLPFAVNTTRPATVQAGCTVDSATNTSLCPWQNATGTVAVSVPEGFRPGTYTGTVRNLFADRPGVNRAVTVTVPTVRNWTLGPATMRQNVSVGTSGVYGRLPIGNTGNVQVDLAVNATGNLSQFLVYPDAVQRYPGIRRNVTVEYRVPRDQRFGRYTGQLQVTDGDGMTQAVNLSTRFVDDTPPEITDVRVPDVMATRRADWQVVARDNLQVASVQANVSKVVTVQRNNTTVRANQSLPPVVFDHAANTARWTAAFDDTAEITTYYATVAVTDTAGTTVTETVRFNVTGLDAVTVEATNFEFDAVRPADVMAREIFTITQASPVNVTLAEHTVISGNGTPVIGLRRTDQASATTLNVSETITAREPGTYELVVETDGKVKFRGRLTYEPVPQHAPQDLPETVFSGRFVDPTCPEEQDYAMGRFEGEYGYTAGGCVNGRTKVELYAPGDLCQGFADPKECIQGWSLNQIPQVRGEIQTVRRNNADLLAGIVAMAALTVFVLIKTHGAGPLHLYSAPKKKNVNLRGVDGVSTS